MDRCTDGWMEGWMNIYRWINGCLNRWMDGKINR